MSLARACLRLTAVAALRGNTLAENRVEDSRIGSIEGLRPEERKPIIAVYTEDQAGDALSAQNGGPPFRPLVDLVFEISMAEALFDAQAQITDIGCPVTDGELEALLDTLEQQVRTVLFEDVTRPLSNLFRRAYLRATHLQSLRFREEKTGARLAYRYLIIKLELADEPVLVAYDAALTGLDLLPKTFRDIAKAWPDDLPEKAVALAMASAFPQQAVARGITMTTREGIGPRPTAAVTPARGNVGNGSITVGALDPDTLPGNYVVRLATPTSFVVLGPTGQLAGALPIELVPGATRFAAGDAFTITVTAPTIGITSAIDMPAANPKRPIQGDP